MRTELKKPIKIMIESEKLPDEIICLSCLADQSTVRVIANDDACVVCGNPIDLRNLSNIEV